MRFQFIATANFQFARAAQQVDYPSSSAKTSSSLDLQMHRGLNTESWKERLRETQRSQVAS